MNRFLHSLVLTLRRTPLIPFTNSGCSAFAFGPYTCIKHASYPIASTLTCTPFLLVGSIHQRSLPAEGLHKYPHPSLGKLCSKLE